MKVTVISLTEKELERRDYSDILGIEIDGKSVFMVNDGEPEDANLRRDFNDCLKIPALLKQAHEAGVKGEPFEIETTKVDEI